MSAQDREQRACSRAPGAGVPKSHAVWPHPQRYLKLPTWMEREASGPRARAGVSPVETALHCTRRASRLRGERDGHGFTSQTPGPQQVEEGLPISRPPVRVK